MPTIQETNRRQDHVGPVLFQLDATWVARNVTANGYIVQHVERNEKSKRVVPELRGTSTVYVTPGAQSVVCNDYWEAWHVVFNGGAVTITPMVGGNHDVFAVNRDAYRSFLNGIVQDAPGKGGTKGTWKIRGQVYWVAEVDFAAAAWARFYDEVTGAATNQPNSVREAGRLLSRYRLPAANDGLAPGASLGNVLYERKFAGMWNLGGPTSTHYSRSRRFPIMRGNGFQSVFSIHDD